MGLETGTYLADLNPANPSGTDPKAQGDDHIRLIKAAARNSFAGFPGAVMVTGVETQGATENDYAVTVSPAPAAYATAMLVVFKATHANTGAATLTVNSLSAKPVLNVDGTPLQSGDIPAGGLMAAFHDGTSFLLFSANDRAYRGGETYTGTHDFTGAAVTAPTQGAGDGSAKVATTEYVDEADALKADLDGATYAGTHDFTGATTTVGTASPGTNDETAASTAFVQQQAFETALPVQTGKPNPSFLSTDGNDASWGYTLATQSEAEAGSAGNRLMTPQRVGEAIEALGRFAPDVIVQDQRTQSTAGDALAQHIDNVKTLNTVVRNRNGVGSLASNTLILPAGAWMLRARAQVLGTSSNNLVVKARTDIWDDTNSSVLGKSAAVSVMSDNGGHFFTTGEMEVVAITELSSSAGIKVRTRVDGGIGSVTGGAAMGIGTEIYTTLEATRIS